MTIKQYSRSIQILILLFIFSFSLAAQNESYTQLANEFQFSRSINDKWVAELNLIGTYSSTPVESRVLKTFIQTAVLGWAHYYYSPRWKFSTFLAYYYNNEVPDLGQFEAPEWRYALQGTYYINKIGYTLTTRLRPEMRFIGTEDGDFDNVFRYRQQIKLLKPINSMTLRKGVFYAVAAEEMMFRSTSKETGAPHFDRNFFYVGGGFMVTDDLQLELTYSNEFLPRDDNNISYHAINITVTFNNLAKKIRKKVAGIFSNPEEDK